MVVALAGERFLSLWIGDDHRKEATDGFERLCGLARRAKGWSLGHAVDVEQHRMASECPHVKSIAAVLRNSRHIPRRQERPFMEARKTANESEKHLHRTGFQDGDMFLA